MRHHGGPSLVLAESWSALNVGNGANSEPGTPADVPWSSAFTPTTTSLTCKAGISTKLGAHPRVKAYLELTLMIFQWMKYVTLEDCDINNEEDDIPTIPYEWTDIFASLLTAQVEGGEHAVHGVFDCGSHCVGDDE